MDSSITIVTAFIDIGRGNWTVDKGFQSYHHRTTETYFDYFRNLAKLDNQMIIFTSIDLKEKVEQIRKGKPTTVITIDFEKKFKFIIRKIRSIQSNESFKQNIPQHQLIQPEYSSAEYVLVNNLKPYFVTQAIKLNIVQNDLVAWIDFGYCRSPDIINKLTEWKYNFNKSKLHCFTINTKLKKNSQNETIQKMINGDVFVIGGVLVSSKQTWLIFYKIVTNLYRNAINNMFVDDDQYFLAMCYYERPELIELNYLGKNKWFDMFKKYSSGKLTSFLWKIRNFSTK